MTFPSFSVTSKTSILRSPAVPGFCWVPHQLFTVADALGSQHVQQGFGDRTAGRQGGARAGADGNIGQQPVIQWSGVVVNNV